MSGRARLSVRVFVWVCDLCVCVGDRLRMGAGTGRGGGCGRCPRGPPRLGSVAAGAAAVWAGVGAALWFPGRVARRLGAGCRARFSFCSVLAALVFSSRGAAVWITPAVSVCVCVLEGGSLGMRGSLSHLPRRRRLHCLWLPTREAVREQWRVPRGGVGRPGGCDPQPPGGGAAARRSALCCLGLRASPSLLPRAQSVRLGVGMSQRRPPLASHGNLWVGTRPLLPGVGLGELRGARH